MEGVRIVGVSIKYRPCICYFGVWMIEINGHISRNKLAVWRKGDCKAIAPMHPGRDTAWEPPIDLGLYR